MYVIKRDGTRVLFDINKIVNAINRAMIHVDGCLYETETAEEIADIIASEGKTMTVEHIQDRVEEELMKSSRPDVAKAYILYRDQRTKERDRRSKIIKTVMRRTDATAVENSNANVDENSFSGREKEASSDIQKIIALDYTLTPEVSEAHRTMLLYQHDLEKTNIGMHNCLFLDFEKIFTEGFRTRNGDIRIPSSYSTGCQQYAVSFQCQSQVQFGGVGTVHIDYDLAPLVKKSFRKHLKYYFTDVKNLSEDTVENMFKAFEKEHGEICVDNIDIRTVTRHSLRSNYGMVLQETWLRAGTVRENIALGKENATEEEIFQAAKAAHAHSFIKRMPNGYDTVIGEDGGSLSQGQKQLLCIARIMLSLPPMLILDEATSSIDTRTEQKIQDAFMKLMKGRTSFIVAHRLSTIQNADVILVMKDGNVIEKGNHNELLKQKGFYYELYNSQFENK